MTNTVAVTGAYGYLGTLLRTRLEKDSWKVIPLSRRPGPDDGSRHFDLRSPVAPDLLDGTDLLIHCAYDFSLSSPEDIWRVNVEGTRRLLALAARAGARVVVLSSMSAYTGTRQLYGRAKLDIEQLALEAGAIVVRPGLVIGPSPGGMGGSLLKLLKLPMTLTIGGAAHQYPVDEDDFAEIVVALAHLTDVPRQPVAIAQAEPVRLLAIQEALARRTGRTLGPVVGVPWRALYYVLRVGEWLSVPLPFRADSLLGLVHPAPRLPSPEFLEGHGIALPRRVV